MSDPSAMSDLFFRMLLFDNLDSPAAPLMDTKVWSRMPFDLLEKVLLRVPIASRARFQAVSKSLRSLLSSEWFQLEATKTSVSCGKLAICAFVRSDVLSKEGVAVVSEVQAPYKVHKFNLSFLPAEFRTKDTLRRRLHIGKGVLFFAKKLFNKNGRHVGERICVVNPMNMTWRQLPDLVLKNIALAHSEPESDYLYEVWLMGENQRGFQVFVLHSFMREGAHYVYDPEYVYLSVYSTMSHSWTSRLIKCGNPDDQVTLAQAGVCVGQEYVYALGQYRDDGFSELELFKASTGEPVCNPVHPPHPVATMEVGLVQLEEREVVVAVPMYHDICKVLALPDLTSKSWDEFCLPKDLAMTMAPGADFDFDEGPDEGGSK